VFVTSSVVACQYMSVIDIAIIHYIFIEENLGSVKMFVVSVLREMDD
jgi:hypothetical protein